MKSTLRTNFSEVKSVFGFRVRLGNPDLDLENLNPDFPIERTLNVFTYYSIIVIVVNYLHAAIGPVPFRIDLFMCGWPTCERVRTGLLLPENRLKYWHSRSTKLDKTYFYYMIRFCSPV